MQVPLIQLQCGVNSYEWGKLGQSSAAAKFAAATGEVSIEEDKPYAELWMGTHPSLPSKDVETGRTLLDLIQDNQALMSSEITSRYSSKLPFLFKVLSIRKALSIQAHPNKKLAEQIHAKDPKNYPDDNHKPEMAIAITAFDGLCGFRPLSEIAHFLKTVPSLRKLVSEEQAKNFETTIEGRDKSQTAEDQAANKKALQEAFKSLMQVSPDAIASATEDLISTTKSEGANFAGSGVPSSSGQELSDLIIRLNSQFPADIGLFVSFFTNYVKLEPGEAMFLKADDIHAYLSGDIIETMASSDNVVRAGFTPKFKDVDTLTSMLTYNYAPISEQKMSPVDYPYATLSSAAYTSNSSCILYDPPIEEFSVVRTALLPKPAKAANGAGAGASAYEDVKGNVTGVKATFEALSGPSIVICTQGKGTISVGPKKAEMKPGFVFFVGATAECVLELAGQDEFVTFKAFCELQGKESKA